MTGFFFKRVNRKQAVRQRSCRDSMLPRMDKISKKQKKIRSWVKTS
jgi:hypothetical protein